MILIVKKLNGGLRVYVNYRALNALTIPNRNIPPLIKKTLFKLYIIRIYNKFNIIIAFNKIRVREEYKYKIAFLTYYRLYKYTIIPFNLYNIPATF